MQYLRLPNSIIDKVERWEQRHSGMGDTNTYNQTQYRYRPSSLTRSVMNMLGVLYIGAPFFAGLLIISWLPISENSQLLCMFLFILLITIGSIVAIVKLVKRGHRL
ncbi:hypothetical protein BH09PAT4_BH09PAT4_00280 [soil metagenome]